jgi:hypothetical protein
MFQVLMEVQSIIKQQQYMQEECEADVLHTVSDQNKQMLKTLRTLTIDCYKNSLEELCWREQAASITGQPSGHFRLVCADTERYLLKAYNPILRSLLAFRENGNVFQTIVQLGDNASAQMDKTTLLTLQCITDDICQVLFTDFASEQETIVHWVEHFRPVLRVCQGDGMMILAAAEKDRSEGYHPGARRANVRLLSVQLVFEEERIGGLPRTALQGHLD